jgi:hypothetical protein
MPTLRELILVTSPARPEESSSTGRANATWFVVGSEAVDPLFAPAFRNLDEVLAAFTQEATLA